MLLWYPGQSGAVCCLCPSRELAKSKRSIWYQLVSMEVLLKLVLYNSLHDLADDAEQRDGADRAVHRWIRLWISLVNRDDRCSLLLAGKTPLEKQNSNSRLSGLASSALHSSRTLAGISSGPVALSDCRFLRSFLTSLILKAIFSIEHVAEWWTSGADSSVLASWHLVAKVWQNCSALSFDVV